MPCYQEILCPKCYSNKIIKVGLSISGKQRYLCKNQECSAKTFMLNYSYKACELGIKEKITEMAINSCGIRDTARILGINKNTVINTLKKSE